MCKEKNTRIYKKALLLGMIIGDGYLSKNQSLIKIVHNEKQLEYLIYKKKILENILNCKEIKIHKIKPNMYNTQCYSIQKGHKYFRILRKWLYKNDKKFLTTKILNMLNIESIAMWYMDDGCLCAKKRNGKIHAYELVLNTYLSKEENEIIINYFKDKWNITFGLNKSKGLYRLRMGTKEARRFCNLLKDYVIPCMKYKLLEGETLNNQITASDILIG
jgi:hypothetical protein